MYFLNEIPFVELLIIFAILGLCSLGFFRLRRRDPSNPVGYGSTGKWILAGLIGLAVMSITLLFVIALILV